MEIREATVDDLPGMAATAEAFYASSRFLKKFDIEKFCALWAQFLQSGLGVIYIVLSENREQPIVGAIGGIKYPDTYSSELIATEFFWFVREESRGGGLTLYKLFEKWAREQKCSQIRMVHLLDSMPEKLERIYRRLGFEPAETHYVKELKP
jgi:hypothetical protein